MSEAYNPETKLIERLESLEIEARQIAQKRDQAAEEDRRILDRQLKELEEEIETLKNKIKS